MMCYLGKHFIRRTYSSATACIVRFSACNSIPVSLSRLRVTFRRFGSTRAHSHWLDQCWIIWSLPDGCTDATRWVAPTVLCSVRFDSFFKLSDNGYPCLFGTDARMQTTRTRGESKCPDVPSKSVIADANTSAFVSECIIQWTVTEGKCRHPAIICV